MLKDFNRAYIGTIRSSLSKVEHFARGVFNAFGAYNYYTNNCNHFVMQLLTKLKEEGANNMKWDLTVPKAWALTNLDGLVRAALSTDTPEAEQQFLGTDQVGQNFYSWGLEAKG